MKFTGVIGYTMWGLVHMLYLIDWGNRIATMYTWARALTFTKNRAHRVITSSRPDTSSPSTPRTARYPAGPADITNEAGSPGHTGRLTTLNPLRHLACARATAGAAAWLLSHWDPT